jgi:hypothetical protein
LASAPMLDRDGEVMMESLRHDDIRNSRRC